MPFNSIVAGTLSDGRIQLFGYDPLHELVWTTWKQNTDPNSDWVGWSPFLPGNPRNFPVGQVLAAANRPDGALQIFVGVGGGVDLLPTSVVTAWKLSSDPDAPWSEWQAFEVGGQTEGGAIPYITGFTVGALSDGRLQAFINDTQGALRTTWMERPDADSPWVEIVGFAPGPPNVSSELGFGLLVAPIFFSRLQLWMWKIEERGPFWTTWKENEDPDSPWVGWSEFFPPSPFLGTIGLAAGRLSDGRVQLWAFGPGLVSSWQVAIATDSPWSNWQDFPMPTEAPLHTSITAAQLTDGRLQIWATTTGGLASTWKLTSEANSSWAEWSDFPDPT